ncbi:MAG: hypothetical protein AM325_007360 [Candidatus Thorarchaeota archaeon SMTZ1-45]
MTGFGIFLSLTFYVYSHHIGRHRSNYTNGAALKPGRDMWVATLLDCDFEPTKVRFGPAKIIPADHVFDHSAHKENFSRHMERKKS